MRMTRHDTGRLVFLISATMLAMGLNGCVGNRQALITTQKLQLTSQQAIAAISQAKAIEARMVEAHAEIRKAYEQLYAKSWQSQLELQQRILEVEYKNSVAALEEERARLLVEHVLERKKLFETLQNKLNEVLADVDRAEAGAEDASLEARKKSASAPGDLPLLQKSLEADVKYFALAARSREIQLDARKLVLDKINSADILFHERMKTATQKQREKLLAVYTAAKDKLAQSEMPTLDLGPEPQANEIFYDSLTEYITGVEQAATALVDYMESYRFGENSLLSEYIKAAGGGLAGGIMQPVTSLEDQTANLKEAAKGLGRTYLSEIKDMSAEAKETLSRETRDMASNLTEELMTWATTCISGQISGTEN